MGPAMIGSVSLHTLGQPRMKPSASGTSFIDSIGGICCADTLGVVPALGPDTAPVTTQEG